MPNNDRVFELYNGEIFTPETQDRCRRRIHWLCEQVTGSVLDAGCSQGIASILLAREGCKVVGVDFERDALDYARREIEKEPASVQKNVAFEQADIGQLPYRDGTFDTVLLGEVLEHLVHPRRILQEVSRVLKPQGKVVITTPLGIFRHPDHKQTFLVSDVLELLDPLFSTVELDLREKTIFYVGTNEPARISWMDSEEHAAEILRKLEREYLELNRQFDTKREQFDRLSNAYERKRRASVRAREVAETAAGASISEPARNADPENQRLLVENVRLSTQFEQVLGHELETLRRQVELERLAREQSARDLAGTDARIQRLEGQLEERDKAVLASQARMEQVENLLAERDRALSASTARTAQLKNQLEERDKTLAASMAQSQRLEGQLEEREKSLSAGQSRFRQLEEQLAERSHAVMAGVVRLKQLENQLAEREKALAVSVARAKRFEGQLGDRDQMLMATVKRSKDLENDLAERQRAVSENARRAQELEIQLATRDQVSSANDQHLRDLEVQLATRDQALSANDQRLKDLEVQLGDRERSLSAGVAHSQALEARCRELESQLENRDQALVENVASLRMLEDRLVEREQTLAASLERVRELEDRLSGGADTITASTSRTKELEDQIEDRERALTGSVAWSRQLESQLEERKQALVASLARLQQMEARLADFERAMAASAEQCVQLENQVRAREKTIAVGRQRIQRLEAQLQESGAAIAGKSMRVTELENKAANEQAARQKLNESLQRYAALNETRKKQLNELVEWMDTARRSGSYRLAVKLSAALRMLGYHRLRDWKRARQGSTIPAFQEVLPTRDELRAKGDLLDPMSETGAPPPPPSAVGSAAAAPVVPRPPKVGSGAASVEAAPKQSMKPPAAFDPTQAAAGSKPSVSKTGAAAAPLASAAIARPPSAAPPRSARLEGVPASMVQPLPEVPPMANPDPENRISAAAHGSRRPANLPSAPKDPKELRVGAIMDPFSRACFQPECDFMTFRPDNWRDLFERRPPHLLLVESAWRGNDETWRYRIGTYTARDYAGLRDLRPLIDWCTAHRVPTVFWNKEDPIHFDRFKEAAALFDVILTTDGNCIERYRQLSGLRAHTVEAMSFAAQPLLHHPIGGEQRLDEPCFAGTYYRNRHPERRQSLEVILDAARPFGLVIYDRTQGDATGTYGFPERFQPHIRGSLPYEELVEVYRRHKIFLNANSVTDSPTMFSRRVFELLACGTAVVSTESLGIRQTFGDLVPIVHDEEQAGETIRRLITDDAYRQGITSRAMQLVLSKHTYRHRLAALAQAAGYEVTAERDSRVAVVALIEGSKGVLLPGLSSQTLTPTEIILGTNGSGSPDDGSIDELRKRLGAAEVRVVSLEGEPSALSYQRLAKCASSPWVWPVNTSHAYDPRFLESLMMCREFVQADVIGMACCTSSAEGTRDREMKHRYVQHVHPGSAVAKRDLVSIRGWPASVGDSRCEMERWSSQGVRFYSADVEGFRPAPQAPKITPGP